MSSIPSSKMKHAHAHEGDHPEQAQHEQSATPKSETQAKETSGAGLSDRAKELGGRAQDLAEGAVDAVKARPKTAAAIGAAIVAGAAALVGGPAAIRALKGDDDKPNTATNKKKSAAKKA
jgi:hypothetical protein